MKFHYLFRFGEFFREIQVNKIYIYTQRRIYVYVHIFTVYDILRNIPNKRKIKPDDIEKNIETDILFISTIRTLTTETQLWFEGQFRFQ